MASTYTRTVRCTPYRSASDAWRTIITLMAKSNATATTELESVLGIAASIIVDEAPRDAPIIVTCDGPRTRFYCSYDEDALDDADGGENALSYDPLAGDWAVSLPCLTEELAWVQPALKNLSTRITARDVATGLELAASASTPAQAAKALTLDVGALLK